VFETLNPNLNPQLLTVNSKPLKTPNLYALSPKPWTPNLWPLNPNQVLTSKP